MRAYMIFRRYEIRTGVTPYDGGLHKEAPLERGTFLRLQVYERGGIPLVELYEDIFFLWEKAQEE